MTAPTPAISTALAVFNSALAAVPSIKNAAAVDLIPIQTAGAALQRVLANEAATQDALILADPLDTPDGGVISLPATIAAIQAESDYLNAQYYFGRATVNIQNDLG